ncbi:LOW QUALITY PROTEIN: uncharacterized protein LOC128721835 [Anopheles nili]|uniref:LOW QUALITY PROTEIN: uncharacterized protein LOC128721835 n=1 Tax=Anopheles nili TaxID=185578 RepID=UPI00237A3A2F|nr:LOW QUALITY PROTEIN: uncharacterized protein LOC128721835 [Anopheles nili]
MTTPIFITVPTKYIPINVAPVVTKPSALKGVSEMKPLAKRPTSVAPSSMVSDEESSSMDEFIVRGKKRRLDHLTWEEKILRKKLKNRVAAQTSRDRKKAKMEDMEQTIQNQSDQIDDLQNKCRALDSEKAVIYEKYLDLERRFEDLQQRLLAQEQKKVKEEPQEDEVGGSVGCVTAGRQTGSAASPRCPQQQGLYKCGPAETQTTLPPAKDPRLAALKICPLPTLQDMLEDFDMSQLEELAESLLANVGAGLEDIDREGGPVVAEGNSSSQCLPGSVVGSTSKFLEPSRPETPTGSRLILTTHNYSKSPFYEISDAPQENPSQEYGNPVPVVIVENQKTDLPSSDTFYGTYDNETNCITIVLADSDGIDETTDATLDITGTNESCEELLLHDQIEKIEEPTETEIKQPSEPLSALAPVMIRPPSPLHDLLSPIPTQALKSPGGFSSFSDAGYESLGSPVSSSIGSEITKSVIGTPKEPLAMSLDVAFNYDFDEFWNLDPFFPILE